MKRESGYVNRVELLITLDYLFKNTDKDHPATCPLICKYATKYGIAYDPTKRTGNQINRHRISSALKFLYIFVNQNKGIIPFEIMMTDGGKYYAENRNDLSVNDVTTLLESIEMNKILTDLEKSKLINKVEHAALNKKAVKEISNELSSNLLLRKYSDNYSKKLGLLKKALKENKLINIKRRKYNLNQKQSKIGESIVESWYRVYKLCEFQNRLFAILVSVDGNTLSLPVEEIEFAEETLIDEFEGLENIDKRLKNSFYGSMDELLKDNKVLVDSANYPRLVKFIFNKQYSSKIKESFEYFFSIEFIYESKVIKELKDISKSEELNNFDDDIVVGFCEIKVNSRAFLNWVRNDYIVAREITILSPKRMNSVLAYNFKQLNDKYSKYVGKSNE